MSVPKELSQSYADELERLYAQARDHRRQIILCDQISQDVQHQLNLVEQRIIMLEAITVHGLECHFQEDPIAYYDYD